MALRLPEQKLWDKMRKALAGLPHKILLERIENMVGDGIPDVLCSTKGAGACFIELKARDVLPLREDSKVLGSHGVRVSQRNWHFDWRRNGGVSFFLIGLEQKEFLLLPGKFHDSINDMSLSQLRDAAAASGWEEIAKVLKGTK